GQGGPVRQYGLVPLQLPPGVGGEASVRRGRGSPVVAPGQVRRAASGRRVPLAARAHAASEPEPVTRGVADRRPDSAISEGAAADRACIHRQVRGVWFHRGPSCRCPWPCERGDGPRVRVHERGVPRAVAPTGDSGPPSYGPERRRVTPDPAESGRREPLPPCPGRRSRAHPAHPELRRGLRTVHAYPEGEPNAGGLPSALRGPSDLGEGGRRVRGGGPYPPG